MHILFAIGFSTTFSYAKNFSYELLSEEFSYVNKYVSSYVSLNSNENIQKPILKVKELSLEEKALNIANECAPCKVEEICSEYLDDENGRLLLVKVYLDFSSELPDETYIEASIKATALVNSKDVLVKYL